MSGWTMNYFHTRKSVLGGRLSVAKDSWLSLVTVGVITLCLSIYYGIVVCPLLDNANNSLETPVRCKFRFSLTEADQASPSTTGIVPSLDTQLLLGYPSFAPLLLGAWPIGWGLAAVFFVFAFVVTDPGIVHWGPSNDMLAMARHDEPAKFTTPGATARGARDQMLGGVKLFQQFYYTGENGFDIHFCPQCKVYVQGFDHHCQIVGACVGRGTWPLFLGFVTSTFLCCLGGFPWVVLRCFVSNAPWTASGAFANVAMLILLWVAGLGSLGLSGKLTLHHWLAVYRGQHSRERRFQLFVIDPATTNFTVHPKLIMGTLGTDVPGGNYTAGIVTPAPLPGGVLTADQEAAETKQRRARFRAGKILPLYGWRKNIGLILSGLRMCPPVFSPPPERVRRYYQLAVPSRGDNAAEQDAIETDNGDHDAVTRSLFF